MAPYETREYREAREAKRIARPVREGEQQEPWQELGYPSRVSYEVVQGRQLKNKQRLERRRRAKTSLFRDQAPGGHKTWKGEGICYRGL